LSSPRKRDEGDTLVVAPGHLIHQWKDEITKFAGTQIEVVVGRKDYDRYATSPPLSNKHRVILIDVADILSSEKLWYDFRRVYSVSHDEHGIRHLTYVNCTPKLMEEYKKGALFCVKSPKGPCSYVGYVYTSTLHMPHRPWRRIIYDEIQDLVSGGTESAKNLLQLSRTATNVWLLSATPFPHGNRSVHANHELLGFCRLKLDVEKSDELPHNHPFEVIKRKLYIRSPKHVADEAVTASKKTTHITIYVDATPLERKFFELESDSIDATSVFGDEYASLRQMMIHPEACKKLREDAKGGGNGRSKDNNKSNAVGQFATVNSFARRSLTTAKDRLQELDRTLIPNAQKDIDLMRSSWYLALKIQQLRETAAIQANPFARREESPSATAVSTHEEEDNAIHAYFCRCPYYYSPTCKSDDKTLFQTIGRGPNAQAIEISGYNATGRVIDYFRNQLKPGQMMPYNTNGGEEHESLTVFIGRKEASYKRSVTNKEKLVLERSGLLTRIRALEQTVKIGGDVTRGMTEAEQLVARNGSKTAALIQHLREIWDKGEKTIVFSYWHDALSLVHKSLRSNGLDVVFCNGKTGNMMTKVIQEFTSGTASILLLSAEVKASGANLQVATNVILLDPAGASADHGANLETQAIGRAVRMGQEGSVNVVRFCVKDTVEEELFRRIDEAAMTLAMKNNDDTYMCESAHKSLDEKVLEKRVENNLNDDGDDVFVGESISAGERVARAMAQAIAKNEIIVIDESDDENCVGGGKLPSTVDSSASDEVNVDNISTANRSTILKAEPPSIEPTAKRNFEAVVGGTTITSSSDKRPKFESDDTEPIKDIVSSPFIKKLDSDMSTQATKEIITVEVVKPFRHYKVGLCLLQVNDKTNGESFVRVQAIAPEGLFHRTRLEAGMMLVSINGVACTTVQNAAQLFQEADRLTITAVNRATVHKQPENNTDIAGVITQSDDEMASCDDSTDDKVELYRLLKSCGLGLYMDTFIAAGILSISKLKAKVNDLCFMERFVQDAGLSASETIRLQICASKDQIE
jgi:hypothetical protein